RLRCRGDDENLKSCHFRESMDRAARPCAEAAGNRAPEGKAATEEENKGLRGGLERGWRAAEFDAWQLAIPILGIGTAAGSCVQPAKGEDLIPEDGCRFTPQSPPLPPLPECFLRSVAEAGCLGVGRRGCRS